MSLKVRGAVYCFGDNALSQLGRKNTTDVTSYNKPEKVKFSSKVKIKTVSCGVSHTAALTGWFAYTIDITVLYTCNV